MPSDDLFEELFGAHGMGVAPVAVAESTGRKNQRRGAGGERVVEKMNAAYQDEGRAFINRVRLGVTVSSFGPGGTVKGRAKKQGVDFQGISRGRGVAFDAKVTTHRTSFRKDLLHGNQFGWLRRWHEAGGIAFLLVNFKAHALWYAIPFDALARVYSPQHALHGHPDGKASLPLAWFKAHALVVPIVGRGKLPDYLAVVLPEVAA